MSVDHFATQKHLDIVHCFGAKGGRRKWLRLARYAVQEPADIVRCIDLGHVSRMTVGMKALVFVSVVESCVERTPDTVSGTPTDKERDTGG